MSTRTRSSLLTIVAVIAIPLLTGAKGPGCGGEVSLGDDKGECPTSSCGALPATRLRRRHEPVHRQVPGEDRRHLRVGEP